MHACWKPCIKFYDSAQFGHCVVVVGGPGFLPIQHIVLMCTSGKKGGEVYLLGFPFWHLGNAVTLEVLGCVKRVSLYEMLICCDMLTYSM